MSNYLIGDDPSQWASHVPRFQDVRYHDLYPGIDMIYRSHVSGMEYDFVVGPGADSAAIALRFEGQDRLELTSTGDLRVHTADRVITHRRPSIYQETKGQRRPVSGHYELRDPATVGFVVGRHDPTRPLVIDPIVSSTYLGGSGTDSGNAIAVDSLDATYVAGSTSSNDFPTTTGTLLDACPSTCPNGTVATTAFVTKYDAQGAVVYSTYLGGADGLSVATGIAVDGSGRTYVVGQTTSTSFPTASPAQAANGNLPGGGMADAFLTKLDETGAAMMFSTYLGGGQDDAARAVAVDGNGSASVTGETQSPNFPLTEGALPVPPTCVSPGVRCPTDGFVSRFSSAGALAYSTALGGATGYDYGLAIAVDASDNVYVTGKTESRDFPTRSPIQASFTGFYDVFVTKLDTTPPQGVDPLVYSTYLGGPYADEGAGIALDEAGSAYVAGLASGPAFPLVRPLPGAGFGFVAKLAPSGSSLVYSTKLGTDPDAGTRAFAVDIDAGSAYVTGSIGNDPAFPAGQAFQATHGGGSSDAFVARIDDDGSTLSAPLAAFLGGSGDEAGLGIAVGSAGQIHAAGVTTSADFPLMNATQGTKGGLESGKDAFVVRLGQSSSSTSTLTVGTDGTGSGTVTSNPSGISCGIDCTEAYNDGTSVTLTAKPAAGSEFAGWSGACSGTTTCTLIMDADRSGTATFTASAAPQRTLTVRTDGRSGVVTSNPSGIDCGSDCTEAYNDGTSVTLTANPAAGSEFAGWSGACSGSTTCTLIMDADRSATATFTASPPPSTTTTTTSTITPGSTTTTTPGTTTTTAPGTTATTGGPPVASGAPSPSGYRLVASDGGIFAFGDALFFGSTGSIRLAKPVVGIERTPSGNGYWLVSADGGVFAYGDARFHGSTGGIRLGQPIVGIERTPSGNGYWLVAADGGVFAFGDARFFGSTGATRLSALVVGMSRSASGNGYWLVGADGGVFAFGDARFLGSTGSVRLSRPVIGLEPSPSRNGYWLVASDGGVFAFGDARFNGSTGAIRLNAPIVGMAVTTSGNGYWLCARDGGVFALGGAAFRGSMGGSQLNAPMVGCS